MGCCFNKESEDRSNVKSRRCTDLLWLTIYIFLWIFMVLIGVFAYLYGNPMRLGHGCDSFGNTCGSSQNENIGSLNLSGLDLSSKPFIFFLDATNTKYSLQICVESCPNIDIHNIEELRAFYINTGTSLCRYDYNVLDKNDEDVAHGLNESLIISSSLGPCPKFPVYQSAPVLNRCIPSNTKSSIHSFLKSWDVAEQFLYDIYSTWLSICGLCFIALVLSLAMVFSFHWLAGFVGHIILICVSVFAVVGTLTVWWTYFDMKRNFIGAWSFLEESISNREAFLFYSVIASVITVIILIIVFFLRSQVSFLVTLFEESGECLGAIPYLYATPVLSFIQLMIFYALWISVIVFLASARYPDTEEIRPFSLSDVNSTISQSLISNDIKYDVPPPIMNISVQTVKTFTRVDFTEGPWIRYMWWIYLIGLVWVSEFILACQQMVIAGVVAGWYFNGKRVIGNNPVWKSIKNVSFYHLGSVALGSLLIPLFKLPRLIMKYTLDRFNHYNKEKCCINYGLKVCMCCCFCFDNCIRYMNHNAYTVVAMQGIDFCPAANRAWMVLAHNPLRVASYNIVGDIVLFLAKALITAVTGLAALIVFKTQSTLHFYAAPTLLVCVFAFFIAHCVISVHEIVIDTLFLCICEDKDINEDNGVWKSCAIARVKFHTSETSPMNHSGGSSSGA